LIVLEGVHYDLYDKPDTLATASNAARDWFTEHLLGQPH